MRIGIIGAVAIGLALVTGLLVWRTAPSQHIEGLGGTGGGQVAAPSYPTQRAPGYWTPPALDPANFARNVAIDEAERVTPLLAGSINGFRFFGPGDPLKEYPCDPNAAKLAAPGEMELPLEVGYFPAGTVEEAPRVQICPDGTLQLAVRSFQVAGTAFSVSYHAGERAIYNDSIREGRTVRPAVVNGAPAVIVEPATRDGYGESLIVWETANGFIRLYAVDLPLDELLKVAETVRCNKC